jgi:hypothetical protein
MHRKLQRLRAELERAIAGIRPEDLSRRPEGKWCAAEILEHLKLTYAGTIKHLQHRLDEGTPAKAARNGKRWQRFLVIRLGYFPRGRQSPPGVRPRGAPPEAVIAEVFQNIEKMERVIGECERIFGKRIPIADHFVLGPLTAGEWRGFHLTHGKHHARQIVSLKET